MCSQLKNFQPRIFHGWPNFRLTSWLNELSDCQLSFNDFSKFAFGETQPSSIRRKFKCKVWIVENFDIRINRESFKWKFLFWLKSNFFAPENFKKLYFGDFALAVAKRHACQYVTFSRLFAFFNLKLLLLIRSSLQSANIELLLASRFPAHWSTFSRLLETNKHRVFAMRSSSFVEKFS